MDRMANFLLLVQVVHERWLKSLLWLLLLFLVLVAFVLGAFTAFTVIDRVVWGL